MSIDSIDPIDTYVVLGADGSAMPLPGGQAFWSRPETELEQIGQSWLVTEYECAADWPNWEMHPNADEFVYLLSGAVTMHLETNGELKTVALQDKAAIIVPKGVRHTAKVDRPSRMLFVTLGAGTRHRPA